MNASRLLEHFDRISGAPDAIPKLRKFILDLAIHGKLVRQDPADEPAEDLLVRMRSERVRLKREGHRGRGRSSATPRVVESSHRRFAIPQSWCHVTLGEISTGFRYGTSVRCSYDRNGAAVLRIPNIRAGRITRDDLKYGALTTREEDELRLQLGDILIVRSNGSLDLVGRAAMVDSDSVGYSYAGYLVRVRTDTKHVSPPYLILALASTLVRDQIEIPIRTTVGLKNVNATELAALTFPLPPRSEQERIVKKVAELADLCDRFGSAVEEVTKSKQALFDCLVNEAAVTLNRESKRGLNQVL